MGSKAGKLLKQVAIPAAAAYFAPGIGAALGPGLSAASQGALGGALAGGVGGLASGKGLSGALTGAATGGLGGYASAGGFGDIGGGISDALGLDGTAAGRLLTGGSSFNGSTAPVLTNSGGLSPLPSGITGGGGSSFGGGSSLSNILSAGLGTAANNDAEEELLKAQQRALGAIEPFQNTAFTPQDLQNDPGYQFQLQQGEQALERGQAARGKVFSGEALKAAQDYGQGLASTSFNEANNRFNTNRNFNYGVAQDQAGVFGNQGNISANSGINNSNLLSGALSGILGGNGINNTGQPLNRTIIGYNPQTGEPIYG